LYDCGPGVNSTFYLAVRPANVNPLLLLAIFYISCPTLYFPGPTVTEQLEDLILGDFGNLYVKNIIHYLMSLF